MHPSFFLPPSPYQDSCVALIRTPLLAVVAAVARESVIRNRGAHLQIHSREGLIAQAAAAPAPALFLDQDGHDESEYVCEHASVSCASGAKELNGSGLCCGYESGDWKTHAHLKLDVELKALATLRSRW